MKKILLSILVIFLIFSSCTKLEDLNKNTKDPSSVPGEYLFTGAQKNLFDIMVTPNVNQNIFRMFTQQWTETTYTDEANYDLVTRSIPDDFWDAIYLNVLENLNQSKKLITEKKYINEAPAIKTNKLAIIEILTVYSYATLVETFGNIPYTQALDINNVTPAYDDGLTVYKDLITRLNAAIAALDNTEASFDGADNMYGGDVAAWYLFANSYKLHMGMVMADLDNAYAKIVVEEAAPNVFTSNADNAVLPYSDNAQDNSNPVYLNLVASGRHDFVPANTLVDAMNTINDPRRPFYFTLKDTSTVPGTYPPVYIGGVYGEYSRYSKLSHVASALQAANFEGMIFDYAEVEFLLAEAVERGYSVGGTAADHYTNAITASMEYWGVASSDIATYLALPDVTYSSATWKEKIGTQQWFAYYNRGFEAWTEWRRLDYPVLVAPVDAKSVIPLRYTFPVEEQTLNGANFYAAVGALGAGGDAVSHKLFWDLY
jgi:hypothetical protein